MSAVSETKPLMHSLIQLSEELTGICLIEKGTVEPFFLLATKQATKQDALHIPVDYSNEQLLQFTTVKIAAILQSKKCDHYCFTTKIQFKAKAGDKEIMKQQVIILIAQKEQSEEFSCHAKLYDLKLNQQLGRPQLEFDQDIENYDGQFSNLFSAPLVPKDLVKQLIGDTEQFSYR